ncbi:MAG: tetratricopeptide repeat protein [Acidobacteria bacterium]|nr:tetratricopeptide repeat protein [Acidobacteriota bacterium]
MRLGHLALRYAAWGLLATATTVFAQKSTRPASDSITRADAAFRAGVAARESGNLEVARSKFTEVVTLQPRIAEGHQALGTVLVELGKPLDGAREFEAAARIKPGDQGIETNLALAYARAGEAPRAIQHFQSAESLSHQPGHPAPDAAFYDSYGRALVTAGKPDQAALQFIAEESLTGPRADIEDAIGSCYAQQSRWDDAHKMFEHALQLDNSYVRARVHLAVVQREQKDLQGALNTLAPAVEMSPPNAEVLIEAGRTFAAAGRDEDALHHFDAAVKADPRTPGVQLELAMALQRLGRQQEAVPWFQQAIAREPKNVMALANLGLALTLTGKGREALEYIKRALVEDPKDAVAWKDLGVCHIQLSAFDEAIEDFKKALALDPDDPQVHYDLGLAYKFKDRTDEAVAELSKAGEMDPKLQDPPYTLGILYMQLGRLDEAVTELRKAVALRPENGDAWAILGSTLKQDSRLPEAAEALKKAIPLQPGQPGPRVTLAGVLAEQAGTLNQQAEAADTAGDPQKAESLRAEMKQLRSEAADYRKEAADLSRTAVSRQRANFALNAGNQQMLRGDIAGAISRYQESIAADPTFSEAHSQLAIAYERQGRVDEARTERAKAAETGKTQ